MPTDSVMAVVNKVWNGDYTDEERAEIAARILKQAIVSQRVAEVFWSYIPDEDVVKLLEEGECA